MKRWSLPAMIVLLVCCLCGCDSKHADGNVQTPLAENMIHLYVVQDNTVIQTDEDYQLKTPDSISASIDDVMTALLENNNSKIESYSYMIGEDNGLALEINVEEESLNSETKILMMAAITKTLFQLNDISTIQLTMNTKSGEIVETQVCNRDSLYFYGYDDNLAQKNICVYIPADTAGKIKPVILKKQLMSNVSEQEGIVNELAYQNVIPTGTQVNMVSVHDKICYLDLSKDFIGDNKTISSEVSVYALVNSIVNQCDVDFVQILVDGERVNEYVGNVNILEPLCYNSEIVE